MTIHTNDSVFASDHDREVVCNQLAAATGEGRITADEHESLVTRALASRKRGELRRLIGELPNPKLPELPQPVNQPATNANTPTSATPISVRLTYIGVAVFSLLIVFVPFYYLLSAGSNTSSNSSTSLPANPTPNASIADPQDRAFVQTMIDYHNSSTFADSSHPTDVDETAVLDIAHKLRNPVNDVRQQFLLIMDSNAYKELTKWEKYRAGKMTLSVWRAGDEAAWVGLGKDQGYE